MIQIVLFFLVGVALLAADVFAASFVLCALGALLPAWRAVRLMPAEALRRI